MSQCGVFFDVKTIYSASLLLSAVWIIQFVSWLNWPLENRRWVRGMIWNYLFPTKHSMQVCPPESPAALSSQLISMWATLTWGEETKGTSSTSMPLLIKNLLMVRGASIPWERNSNFHLEWKLLRCVPEGKKRALLFWLLLTHPADQFSLMFPRTICSLFCNPQCLGDDGDDAHLFRPPPECVC